MQRIENKEFIDNNSQFTDTLFYRCKFIGNMPDCIGCEIHDSDMSRTKVGKLISCKLFSTRMDEADFSNADVRFSITTPGSPCLARKCTWKGIIAVMDCGFFQGLGGEESDANLFMVMAMIPETPLKSKLYKNMTPEMRKTARGLLTKEFRKI